MKRSTGGWNPGASEEEHWALDGDRAEASLVFVISGLQTSLAWKAAPFHLADDAVPGPLFPEIPEPNRRETTVWPPSAHLCPLCGFGAVTAMI